MGNLTLPGGDEQSLRKGISEQVRFHLGLEMNTHVAGKEVSVLQAEGVACVSTVSG